jgi:hypothetical protein
VSFCAASVQAQAPEGSRAGWWVVHDVATACAGIAHLDRSRRDACAVCWQRWQRRQRTYPCHLHCSSACSEDGKHGRVRACVCASPCAGDAHRARRLAHRQSRLVEQRKLTQSLLLRAVVHSPWEVRMSIGLTWTSIDMTAHSPTDPTGLQQRPAGDRPAQPQQQRPPALPWRRTVREGCCVRWDAQAGVRGCAHWPRTRREGVRTAPRQLAQYGSEAPQTGLTLALLRSLSAITIHNEAMRRPVPMVYAYALALARLVYLRWDGL